MVCFWTQVRFQIARFSTNIPGVAKTTPERKPGVEQYNRKFSTHLLTALRIFPSLIENTWQNSRSEIPILFLFPPLNLNFGLQYFRLVYFAFPPPLLNLVSLRSANQKGSKTQLRATQKVYQQPPPPSREVVTAELFAGERGGIQQWVVFEELGQKSVMQISFVSFRARAKAMKKIV